MTYKKIAFPVFFSIAVVMYSCSSTKTATATTTGTAESITYSTKVKAIIDEHCGNSCHNATRPAKGIDLTNFASVKDQTLNGMLIPAIQHAEGVDPMPKGHPKLSDADIQAVVEWAAAGAKE